MSALISVILASLLVSCISFAGVVILAFKKKWSSNMQTMLVSFAAGVMLSASILDLMPEALEEAGEANIFPWIFAGVVSFFLLERFVLWFHHHDDGHGDKPAAILVLVGDAIHNLIDGVAIAATFLVNPALGVTATLAIAAHEIPQEIADFGVLVASGMKKTKALLFNFLSGLTALIGAVIGFYFLDSVQGYIWIALAYSAGMFLYIACSDLIPELHKDFKIQQRWVQTMPFVVGATLLWAMVKILEG